jgi:hypothetical protein
VRDCEILSGFVETNDPNVAVNGAQFRPGLNFVGNQEYRVLLKGDFIRDAKNKQGIDADHLPPWLPNRPTGDGTEGGTFESWFVTVQVPLKVSSVQILSVQGDPSGPGEVLATMEDPSQPLTVQAQQQPNTIEVEFSDTVSGETVIDGSTFIVEREDGEFVSGQIVQISGNTIRWSGLLVQTFTNFLVTLVGDGPPAITTNEGQRLDGEPLRLPSGDNTAGGNFVFRLSRVF